MRPSNQKTFSILVFLRKRNNIPNQRMIYLRITVNSKPAELSLNIKIDLDIWDERRKRTKGNSQIARRIQNQIDDAISEIHEIYKRLRLQNMVIDAATIKNRYLQIEEPNNSLLDLFIYH